MSKIIPYAQLPDSKRTERDYILLDGSASMTSQWWTMMDAIETYVEGLKGNKVTTWLTLNVFSGPNDLEMIQRDCTLADWVSLIQDPAASTWGDTPLYDAINLMARRLRDEDPLRCSITICTDGEENGSDHTDAAQAKAILDWCRAKGWQVTFIGCDFDNTDLATKLGAHPSQFIGVSKALLKDAAEELAKKRARHANGGAPMHWSEEEKSQFGGYLTQQ